MWRMDTQNSMGLGKGDSGCKCGHFRYLCQISGVYVFLIQNTFATGEIVATMQHRLGIPLHGG